MILAILLSCTLFANDPLPSWNEGSVKTALVNFINESVDPDSKGYLPLQQRIAVFDNDGTLWPENPIPFQLAFIFDEIRRLEPKHPEWKENKYVQAVLSGNLEELKEEGVEALVSLLKVSSSSITTDEFENRVKNWLKTSYHPRFKRHYNDLAYQPMLELLVFLRKNGFKTFIVSGGGADFMRVFTLQTYGIPPEQVIGSTTPVEFEFQGDRPVLMRKSGVEFIDDKAGKPVGIHRQIGQKPMAAFGNSDGDLQMLQWTTIANNPSLGLIVHHTDQEREYAYDSHPKSSGKLVEALQEAPKRGWIVVDMKKDWKVIFSD